MILVEGDSLAVGMRLPLERMVHVGRYDAAVGRGTHEGISRLLAHRVKGKTVMVSLGTNDVGSSRAWARREIKRLLDRRPGCVIWGLTTNNFAFNAALRSSGVHLVKPVHPDAGDGIHLSPHGYRIRAQRFASAVKTC